MASTEIFKGSTLPDSDLDQDLKKPKRILREIREQGIAPKPSLKQIQNFCARVRETVQSEFPEENIGELVKWVRDHQYNPDIAEDEPFVLPGAVKASWEQLAAGRPGGVKAAKKVCLHVKYSSSNQAECSGLTPRVRVSRARRPTRSGYQNVNHVSLGLRCGQSVVGIVAVHPSFSDADRTLATCSSEYRDTLVNNLGPSLTFSFAGFFLRKYFRWSTFQQPVEHADALSHLLRARHKYSMHMHTFF
jgi:hypothetical protein